MERSKKEHPAEKKKVDPAEKERTPCGEKTARTQYPTEEMQACTIAKDFREALEPTKNFQYEEVPILEL